MRVLLIGAGRYGNNLVGRKYASGEFGVKLAGVIDTKIDEIKKGAKYYMEGIPTYHSLEEVPKALVKDTVADIALTPQVVPQMFESLANSGIKKIILPKPVTTNFEDYKRICSIADENNMQALVASNWHYSTITKKLKNLVREVSAGNYKKADKRLAREIEDNGYDINRVAVEYSKKDETLAIDPPLQELPHAMQILISSKLVKKLRNVTTTLDEHLQSKSRVNLTLSHVDGVKDGITVNSDLKSGNKLKDNRIRKVEIFMDNQGKNEKITADYDAVFDENGICKKYPEITYEYIDGGRENTISYAIKEDNLNTMYGEMFKTLNGKSNRSLTLEDYKPLAEYLSDIEQHWQGK